MSYCPNCGELLTSEPSDTEAQYEKTLSSETKEELSNLITFGKYRGQSLDFVLQNNPSYIVWASENVEFFSVSPQLLFNAKNRVSVPSRLVFEEEEEGDHDYDDDYGYSFFDPYDFMD